MTRRVLPAVLSLVLATGSAGQAALAATSQPDVNFKIYAPSDGAGAETPAAESSEPALGERLSPDATPAADPAPEPTSAAAAAAEQPAADPQPEAASSAAPADTSAQGAADGEKIASKVLQGYIRVVPSGTKIPIIMDTAVDTDTSQEGDEFSARTGEDLTIDGSTVVPAGSVIKGRIAQLNAPRRLDRSGSVALKFDTVTTPDNRQIPIVANLVARGGVVHARRGLKDIAMDTGVVVLPTAVGLGIGLLAGNANSGSSGSSKLGAGGGALIGAGVGAAVGVIILLSKKGKKVDVRPGDELKIELAEDLRMPM